MTSFSARRKTWTTFTSTQYEMTVSFNCNCSARCPRGSIAVSCLFLLYYKSNKSDFFFSKNLLYLQRISRFLLFSWDKLELCTLTETYLAQVHYHALVDFLPQMGSEDLNQRDFEGRDFTVHEYSGQVELYLKADVHLQ